MTCLYLIINILLCYQIQRGMLRVPTTRNLLLSFCTLEANIFSYLVNNRIIVIAGEVLGGVQGLNERRIIVLLSTKLAFELNIVHHFHT